MDLFNIGSAIQTTVTKVVQLYNQYSDLQSYYSDTSLPQVTKLTRVEPITVVSNDLLNNPEIKGILNSTLSIFSAHYLQAVDILTKVQDVEVVRLLDRLNPDRDETGILLSQRVDSKESFQFISTENYRYRLPTYTRPALEAINQDEMKKKEEELAAKAEKLARDQSRLNSEMDTLKRAQQMIDADASRLEMGKATLRYEAATHKNKVTEDAIKNRQDQERIQGLLKKNETELSEIDARRKALKLIGEPQEYGKVDLNELINLSIGRMLNVKILYSKENGPNKGQERFVTIPVNVRLLVSSIPNDSIVRIMSFKNQDLSLIERIHSARAGRIEFIRDLMLCQDLIDDYKKATIKDPSNILQDITKRANNAKKYGVLTKNPSLVAASSIFVISDSVAREVETRLGGKLDNPRIRNNVFESTYAMIICVVSKEWETVTFYTRGISRGTTLGFKELEGKMKGSGPDIGDILKSLVAGQPPSF